MDEYNDSVYDEARTLVKATSGGERSLNGHTMREETSLSPYFSTRPEKEALTTTSGKLEAQNLAQRRTRINHFLLMKRRQQRFQQNMKASARPLTLFFVFLIVLLCLVSSGVGGAYAYYQAQLPLLNGMANQTLFQSTRIYDRKGRLLYELYDPKYGRRTYVNYNDISPLLINATSQPKITHFGPIAVSMSRARYERHLLTCKAIRLLRVVVQSPSNLLRTSCTSIRRVPYKSKDRRRSWLMV